jgi:hypothetical protein
MVAMRGWLGLACGGLLGLAGGYFLFGAATPMRAQNSDRFEDYVLCTGPILQSFTNNKFGFEMDGVWMLDYRAGKLLATAVNRNDGKILGWSEVDLVSEFGITPRANVHFLMTTGLIQKGVAALYVAETSSGKFAVYTMAANFTETGLATNVLIRRHDMTSFRGSHFKGLQVVEKDGNEPVTKQP